MRTLVHVGQHKTASTSIQHYLQSHRAAFIKQGLYVPACLGGNQSPSHFMLNVFALDLDRWSPTKERLYQTISDDQYQSLSTRIEQDTKEHYARAESLGCHTILWTNEGLYLLNSQREYSRLYRLFSEHSAKIDCVCCFRNVADFRRSYTSQLQKRGFPLTSDPDSFRYVNEDSWLFNYTRKKSILTGVFDDTIFLQYEPKDMIKTFLAGIGQPMVGPTNLRLNVTPAT